MNLEPPETFLADSLRLGVGEDATFQVVTHMVEVGRDWVHSPSEVAIVREVEFFTAAETLSDLQRQ